MVTKKGMMAAVFAMSMLVAACGGQQATEEPTVAVVQPTAAGVDAVGTSVQQTVAAIAVAQTVAALTTGQAPAPAATPTAAAVDPRCV